MVRLDDIDFYRSPDTPGFFSFLRTGASLAAMQIPWGWKKLRQSAKRSVRRASARCACCTRVTRERERVSERGATLCRVGDSEWQRVRDFQVGMQISHSRMSRGFDSV